MSLIKKIFMGVMLCLVPNVVFGISREIVHEQRMNLNYNDSLSDLFGRLISNTAKTADKTSKLKTSDFSRVCMDDKKATVNNHECVDLFADIKVQTRQALPLARLYILRDRSNPNIYAANLNQLMHSSDIVCSPEYYTEWADDYFQCIYMKDGQHVKHYDFHFDSITASVDSVIINSTKQAICKLMNYSWDDGYCLPVESDKLCQKLDNLAKVFGYSADFKVYKEGNKCAISLSSSEALKRIKGIDSKRFYALQLNNGSDLEFLLEQYVRNKYPNINNFYCTPGVIIKDNDDLVRCSFEYNDENYQIDFLFDDLSETFNHTADAGISGLRCLAAGGNYDGRQCYNLTSNDCYKLGQELEHKDKALGTIWVDDIKACILRASNALDTANTLKNAALATLGIGIAVVAVPVAVAGASAALATGSTAGIIISLGELTAVSVGAVATSTSTAIQVADNFSADNINRKANECIQMRLTNADKTNGVSLEQKKHDCARNVLKYIINNRVNWHDRAIDNNMKLSLDQSISTLIGLINPNSLNETEVTNLFDLVNIVKQNGDWHVSVKKTADILSVLTTVAGVAIIFKGVKAAKAANEFNMANGALKLLTDKIIKLAKQPRTVNGAVALTGTGIKKAYEILDTYNAASNIVQ